MWNNIISQHIQRTNRNLFRTILFSLFCIGLLALCNIQSLLHFLRGPMPVNTQTLLAAKDPSSFRNDFVTVNGEKAIDTGGRMVLRHEHGESSTSESSTSESSMGESSTSESSTKEHDVITSNFLLQRHGDHYLLIKSSYNEEGKTQFTGTIENIPDDVQANLLAPLEADMQEGNVKILPYMLNASDYSFSYDLILGIGALLGFWALWNSIKLALRQNRAFHPLVRRLSGYGDPLDVATMIDRERQVEVKCLCGVELTRSWLLKPSTYNLTLIRLDDLLWAYKKLTHTQSQRHQCFQK